MKREKNESSTEGDSAGLRLLNLVNLGNLDSLKVREEQIKRLASINSIIIVGASGVGKSTLARRLHDFLVTDEIGELVQMPGRVTTRAQRSDDDPTEGASCSDNEFNQLIMQNKLAMHWRRRDNADRYGMLKADEGKFPVYNGNSAMVNNNSLTPAEVLETALIVAVYAPDRVKRERILRRSSDIDEMDLERRFRDKAVGIVPRVDIIVKNFGRYQDKSAHDLFSLVKLVLKVKQTIKN